MGPFEAFEIVARYIVAAGMGWLCAHGLSQIYNDQTFIQAVSWLLVAGVLWAAAVLRALWRSRFAAKASDVAADPAVKTIVMNNPADAAAIPSSKVV